MLADNSPGIQLLATDVRESILQNLTARFRQYHLPLPERQVLDAADATSLTQALGTRSFDGIICDVPCSGSGTWARTPEACYFFRPETLAGYSKRQTAILSNTVQYAKSDSHIIYITCSVFREENEAVVERVAAERGLRIESSRLINGISLGADSLFVAVLRKA
jgi:16S rRNA (cytosine967-C5)-methyltransferase